MDPTRWRDADGGAPDGMRELLLVAPRARPMSGEQRARVAARVGAVALAGGAIGAGWWARAARWPASVKALAIVGGVAALGVVTSRGGHRHRPAAPAIAAVATEPPAASVVAIDVESEPAALPAVAPAPAEEVPRVAPVVLAAPGHAPARARQRARHVQARTVAAPTEVAAAEGASPPPAAAAAPTPSPATHAPAAAHATDGLAREAALLARAQRSLATDPAGALALADRHRREFPDGQLGVERELIAVDALVRQGRGREARARGEAQLARAADGPYADRMRALVAKLAAVPAAR